MEVQAGSSPVCSQFERVDTTTLTGSCARGFRIDPLRLEVYLGLVAAMTRIRISPGTYSTHPQSLMNKRFINIYVWLGRNVSEWAPSQTPMA